MFFKKKSFSSAKCKMALQLAISRIKLLRNMRNVQLKKLKGELIKLLKANQEPSAHLKVEHIHREQNIMAAHEIIELLCLQIVSRLPIIEEQRKCPIDVREAVSTIIYAARHCLDIPELQTIRRFLSAKYGKEFTAIADELRKDCGVNTVVVEKLSTRRPSIEVKLDLMKSTANELRVDWDPKFLKSQLLGSPNDLLKGPPMDFNKAIRMPSGSFSDGAAYYNETPAQVEAETPLAGNSVFSDGKQSSVVEAHRPLSGSLAFNREASSDCALRVPSATFQEYEHKSNTNHAFERRHSFKKLVLATRKAAESAERAAAAAREAVAMASQNHDEILSRTDNENGNDGHSAAPTLISSEHHADNNEYNDERDPALGGFNTVSSSTYIPDERETLQMSSQWLNTRFSSGMHQRETMSSEKWSPEISRMTPHFDAEEWDDEHNENADQAAASLIAHPPAQGLPKLRQRQTSSFSQSMSFAHQTAPLKKSTSFAHPKLPDFDDLVAHFQALKGMNTRK